MIARAALALLLTLSATGARAGSGHGHGHGKGATDPLLGQVVSASQQFDAAAKQLDTAQSYERQAEKKLSQCETEKCEKDAQAYLAGKQAKVAASEEKVAKAADQYLKAEEAYKARYGQYRNQQRVNQIKEAQAYAASVSGKGGSDPDADPENAENLAKYEVGSPDVGGGREIDPGTHQGYTQATRDPGIVDLDDGAGDYARRAAAAQAENGTAEGLSAADGGPLLPGDAKLARTFANPIHDAGARLAQAKVLRGRSPLARVAPLLGDAGDLRDRTQTRFSGETARDAVRLRDGAKRERSRDHVRAGRRNLKAGDYRTAYEQAQQAIAADPTDPAGWLLKAKALSGMAAQETGKRRLDLFADAERAALESIKRAPADGEGYRELAFAQLHLGKAGQAADAASLAIERDATDARAYALRAFAYEQMGRRSEMLADLKRAAELDPNRFEKVYRDALAGLRVFDPNATDSRRLLDAMTAIPEGERGRDGPPLVLLGALLLGCAISGLIASLAWKKLRADDGEHAPPPAVAVARPEPETAREASALLAGKYKLLRTIGRGAWGQVWEAEDTSLGRRTAIKQIAADEDLPQMHLKEARTLASIKHPNIVDIYEVLEVPQGVFLVFELLQGKTIQQLLAERKRLPPREVRVILGAVSSALMTAHANRIVHRDLKPANIMLTDEGHVKIMDFGIARAIEDSAGPSLLPRLGERIPTTQTSHMVGTPGYRPPEAARGIVSAAFDLYSLGVCAFEMLVGRRPFTVDGETTPAEAAAALRREVPGLPPEVETALPRFLDPDFESRSASVAEFVQFLERLDASSQTVS